MTATTTDTRKTAAAFAKYGFDKCQRCWELNRLYGEGPTVQSHYTGLHINSTAAACNAYEAWLIASGLPTIAAKYIRPTFTA